MAISLANSNCSPTRLGLLPDEKGGSQKKQSMWHKLGLRRWLGRDDRDSSGGNNNNNNNNHHHHNNSHDTSSPSSPHSRAASVDSNQRSRHDNLTRRLSRRVGVGLPRSTTFKRQIPERRDCLAPEHNEHRRAQSADRSSPSNARSQSPLPPTGPRLSAPEVQWLGPTPATMVDEPLDHYNPLEPLEPLESLEPIDPLEPLEPLEQLRTNEESSLYADWEGDVTTDSPEVEAPAPAPDTIDMDLENRWILNLSMHFRDRSEREKFFITYVENPYQWRRVTISCDYRGADPDSLEGDLKGLRYQRDKSARIYESLRDSLPDIQFYDTVTNLKVETRDGRLHVHVTEDVNEIIPYPPISSIGHLAGARCIPETHLHFDSHLSGFVYKVQQGGREFIKKEIPGPDTVDEFLYEINALHALNGSPSVIQVGGIVVDEHHQKVKGLLISYAERGALVDILYDQRGHIPFARRERWAKQIVQGLCEIHESGYVQGDFTLSNIVVDVQDNAFIIDINRRGCPVGWEPPEIAQKIESNQRISMYIGVKTDLYQLGMTLWALAMQEDEPERQPRPLYLGFDVDVPDYYRRIVDICLSPMPRHRLSAKELLSFFPSYMHPRPDDRFAYPTTPSFGLKDNLADQPRMRNAPTPNSFPSLRSLKYSNSQDISLPQPVFHDHPDQGNRSTLTLADSTDGVAFPSRHSSASTLNHHGSDGLSGCWNETARSPVPEPISEPLTDHQTQTAVPSVWGNTVGHGLGPTTTTTGPQPQLWESRTESDGSGGCQLPPAGNEAAKIPFQLDSSYHSSSNSTTASQPPPGDLDLAHGEALKPAPLENVTSKVQKSESSDSSVSLFLSALPINPALSRRNSFPPNVTSIRQNESLLVQTGPSDHRLISLLADSQLPINPAVATPMFSHIPKELETPKISETSPKQLATAPREMNTLLSESRLPINPAISLSKRKSFPPASRLRPDQPKIVSDQLVSFLSESRLPINPAMGIFEPNAIRPESDPKPHSNISNIQPTPSIQHRLASSLSDSKLPINPAFRESIINLL